MQNRLLTIVQAAIFGLSTLSRVGQHSAVSTLEVTTMAFIVAMLITSYFWHDKPQGINKPITLQTKATMEEILAKVQPPRNPASIEISFHS